MTESIEYMTVETEKPIKFSFRWVTGGGGLSLFSHKGRLDGEGLTLDRRLVGYQTMLGAKQVDDRLLVLVDPETAPDKLWKKAVDLGGAYVFAMSLSRKKAKALTLRINRKRSALDAEETLRELTLAGEPGAFRTEVCPNCQSTIDLSKLDETTYFYCPYCQNLYGRDHELVDDGEKHKTCEECGMFDRVKTYTEFYFYFLVVFGGISYKRRHMCANCAGRMFWKMLLLNLIFVVGIIPSFYVLIKSMTGRDQRMKDLTRANRLAMKGRYPEAAPLYQEIHVAVPNHPGVLLNEAIGAMNLGDMDQTASLLERSMQSCANYQPTIDLIGELQAVAETEFAEGTE